MSTQSFTGYNPKYNSNQYQNPKFAVTYNIPDKKAPSETVNKIFLRIANGKYFDIKRMIANERSSLNLHDSQNKSIIHYVLMNQGLSKNDKYELINSLLEMGAPVDSSDSSGVRPLHLASGQQNRNLINLLLEKGAEINSQDNNFMTPLHYAVTPETLKCKPINEKKLIPSRDSLMNQRTDPLFDVLFINFQKDPTVRMYIAHLAHIFKFRFPYDDNDVSQDTKDVNQLINESLNQKAYKNDNIQNYFNDKLIGFNQTIRAKTLARLLKSTTKINVKEGTKDGWGPGNSEAQKILPFRTIKNVHAEMHKKITKNTDSVLKNMELNLNDIEKKIDDYVKTVASSIVVTDVIFSFHLFIKLYFSESSPVLINNTSIRKINDSFQKLMESIIVVDGMIPPDNNSMIPDNFNNINSFEPQSIVPYTQDLLEKNNTNSLLDDHLSSQFKAQSTFNIIDNYIGKIKQIVQGLKQNIINLKGDIFQGSVNFKSQRKVINNICDIQLSLTNVSYILFLLTHYHSKIAQTLNEYLNDFTVNNYSAIYSKINTLISAGNNQYTNSSSLKYSVIKFNTNGSGTLIYNDIVLYSNIEFGLNIYVRRTADKISFFSITNAPGFFHRDPSHWYIYPNSNLSTPMGRVVNVFTIYADFDVNKKIKLLQDFTERVNKYNDNLQSIYNVIINVQDKINQIIDIHNQINGSIFMFLFNNQMAENSYEKQKTDIMNNLLISRMKHINMLPKTLDNLNANLQPMLNNTDYKYSRKNIANIVTYLIDTYGYNITDNDKLHTIDIVPPIGNSDNGLISTIIKNNSTVVYRRMIELGSIGNRKKVNRDDTFSGYDYDKNIIDPKMSIVGTVLDEHIYLIKLIIIMYFVQKTYDLKTLSVPNNVPDKILLNHINTYFNNIKDLSVADQIGSFIAMVAKMVDDIMISTIKNFANISATNYTNYLVKKNNTAALLEESLNNPDPGEKFTNLSQLIVKPIDRTKLRDGDFVDQIIIDTIDPDDNRSIINYDTDMKMLQFYANKNSSKTDNFQNRLIDFDSVVSTNDLCFDIDSDTVSLLLSKGADHNIVERSGMTPLWFAIYLQNERIIETLLRAGSKVFDSDQNIYDSVYKQLLNTIKGSPIMNISDINQRVEDHLKNKTSMNQLFSNSHLILEMTSYLFVHQLTANASHYPNLWSRDSHQKILSLIGMDQKYSHDLIPLAKVNPQIINENVKGYMVINQTIDSYKKRLIDERDILIRIDHSIRDIKNEKNNLSLQVKTATENDYRINEMDSLLKELNDQKSVIHNNIKKIMKQIRTLTEGKNEVNNQIESEELIDALNKSNKIHSIVKTQKRNGYVCDIYDTFFKKIMNGGKEIVDSEYMTYINLWTDLLSAPEHVSKRDFTQVIMNLQLYIVEQGVQKPTIFIESWDPICELYEKVLDKYGKDYLELSMFMNNNDTANYVLKQIYCIMFHVFSHIISINYIATITQFLAKQDTGETSNSIVRNVFMDMKTSGFIAHCIDILPHQVIRSVCKIFESEKDPLAQSNVTDILNKSLDLLTQSTFASANINKINIIKESVIPFFTSYMEAYTAEMHSMMVKQIKSFIIQNKWLKIIKLVADYVPNAPIDN